MSQLKMGTKFSRISHWEPWVAESNLFKHNGVEYDSQIMMQHLWMEFALLSPSLRWVHAINSNQCNQDNDFNYLPVEFELVEKFYNDFDIKGLYEIHSVARWWKSFGHTVFAKQSPSEVVGVCYLKNPLFDQPNKKSDKFRSREEFVSLLEQVETPCLALIMPIDQSKHQLQHKFEDILAELFESGMHIEEKNGYSIQPSQIKKDTLITCLKLLHVKAQKPSIAKWRLGVACGVRKSSIPNQYAISIDTLQRKSIESATNKEFRKALYLVENAVRGRFPCCDPIEVMDVDYPATWAEIKKRNAKLRRMKRKP